MAANNNRANVPWVVRLHHSPFLCSLMTNTASSAYFTYFNLVIQILFVAVLSAGGPWTP